MYILHIRAYANDNHLDFLANLYGSYSQSKHQYIQMLQYGTSTYSSLVSSQVFLGKPFELGAGGGIGAVPDSVSGAGGGSACAPPDKMSSSVAIHHGTAERYGCTTALRFWNITVTCQGGI